MIIREIYALDKTSKERKSLNCLEIWKHHKKESYRNLSSNTSYDNNDLFQLIVSMRLKAQSAYCIIFAFIGLSI